VLSILRNSIRSAGSEKFRQFLKKRGKLNFTLDARGRSKIVGINGGSRRK
jgi:hypothetical protein